MTTIVEMYHQWRKRTFPASKEDVAWRHSALSYRLDGIANHLQKIDEFAAHSQTLDKIAGDLQLLKKRNNSIQSRSLAKVALAIVNSSLGGNVKFLQIGGNDGCLADPAYKYIKESNWRGVIVEPVPEYFDMLRKTHEGRSRIECVNVAIDTRSGHREMYKVKSDVVRSQLAQTGDYWLQGCATFSKEILFRNALTEDDIESVPIRTTTGVDLVRDYALEACDVLIIDVEGAEDIVLSSFDFGRWRPKVIVFESEEKTADEIATIEARLVANDYEVNWEYYDSVAVLKQ